MTRRAPALLLSSLIAITACAGAPRRTPSVDAPPPMVLGSFRDDYGSSYEITNAVFAHLPRSRYRIVEWHPGEQFLIAQNDSTNPGEPGQWTRIDWMPLDAMPPWQWGFCLTTWNAPTRAAARATPPADRAAPRVGCGGHPFTRMQRQP